ncbi:MAG: hypothetical protein A2563_00665 [Candidatus Magasanikbacteria bacterium RIFOXYD1_FULL_40_23]|uniref:Uncharacterized protein n=1 Tax=Candidatus Magasanikbacteria bacterium RIFOXYD1_FULL_40_23 TaxID=1798705 RepID=A0A1F6P7B8_9BACT|nr:MAG: hypothetical protein A2563_00665 [Candidatus Magasanikbacteria bacterium RIFOXYD1_FULL_40_23]
MKQTIWKIVYLEFVLFIGYVMGYMLWPFVALFVQGNQYIKISEDASLKLSWVISGVIITTIWLVWRRKKYSWGMA